MLKNYLSEEQDILSYFYLAKLASGRDLAGYDMKFFEIIDDIKGEKKPNEKDLENFYRLIHGIGDGVRIMSILDRYLDKNLRFDIVRFKTELNEYAETVPEDSFIHNEHMTSEKFDDAKEIFGLIRQIKEKI